MESRIFGVKIVLIYSSAGGKCFVNMAHYDYVNVYCGKIWGKVVEGKYIGPRIQHSVYPLWR